MVRSAAFAMLFLHVTVGCDSESSAMASTEAWVPLASSKLVGGKGLDDWAMEWNRWAYSQTSCDSPITDIDGSQCGLYQDDESPVFFLTFAPSKSVRSKCEVPKGKAILVPVATCAIDPVGEDPEIADEELEGWADEALASMRDLKLVVDGKPWKVGEDHAVAPIKHSVHLPSAPNFYSCRGVKGFEDVVLDPVFITGYFALLPPPSSGEHTISYAGAQEILGTTDVSLANMQIRVGEKP